ncbi:LacI family transcriptional regulator [Clavibacter tessellarius]|uniref:LacI family transcriptional regulator n=1 Tax=Clavibacter tessellarius TaxID=31965 RepID=A0A225C8I8_9MICO|nr:LacI family DNA-binding transcriptional regulator [Clavibacter michiganensis]OQJ63077.1 LacI family transcriptional regulator [Clavibacter michiganensis subsp. tessellarius]UKF33940.1 LacI family transcriptional regulator [Clavibacter michiganensis subsp. tessellarius]
MAGPARLSGSDGHAGRSAAGQGAAGREPAGRATIHDVASAAGVSRQTVTRAMNGMPGISEETKRRVLDAADQLAYRPSRFGRGLVTGGDHQLGLVVDDLRNPWSPELASAVVRVAAARGWNVSLADVGLAADSDRMVQALGAQTDAVIGTLGSRAGEWIARLGSVPVVELDPHGEPVRAAVLLDPSDAIDALADHLRAAGVTHPVVLDAAVAAGPSARATSLVRAFEARGMDVSVVRASAPTAEAAAEATERIVARPRTADAIVAFNDVCALGVLSACRRAGVDVPGDVRVVGIDGLSLGRLLAPTLTTLAVDLDELARHALDLAVAMIAGELPRSGPEVVRTVRHQLVVRESA